MAYFCLSYCHFCVNVEAVGGATQPPAPPPPPPPLQATQAMAGNAVVT